MVNQKIKGMPCMVLRRCSGFAQVGTSLKNQEVNVDQCLADHQLTVVENIDLPGVTGSIPGNRTDIDRVIARKKAKNDFRLLVVQDTTRFTRAGQGHGIKLIYDLRVAGVLVYFVAEDLLVDSDMTEMYVAFLFSAGREAVKKLSYASTSGSANSYLNNRSPHTRRPPYGLDRMYSDNGIDLHIIRNLPDGTQEQRHPQTGEVIRTFARNEKTGVPHHYIKQKSERIRLVPGDPRHVAVVCTAFYSHYVLGKSARATCLELNDANIPGPEGEEWWTPSMCKLLRNPIYLGVGIRFKTKAGIHYNGGEGQPVPSGIELQELATNERIKPRRRKRDEWIERPQSHLEEFLPVECREPARVAIEQYHQSIAEGITPTPNRDRHLQSEYLLKGLLRSKQGKYLMTGRPGGKKDHEIRYYAVTRGESAPRTNNVLARRVQAEPTERAVIDVLRTTILNRPDVVAAIRASLVRQHQPSAEGQPTIDDLRKQLKRKRKQLAMLSDDVDIDGDDDVLSHKAATVKQEIATLQSRIRQAESRQKPIQRPDNDALANQLADKLQEFGKNMDPADIPTVKKMLETLVSRLEVDLETKEVTISFAVPEWTTEAITSAGAVGLDSLFACKQGIETHPQNSVILADFHCVHQAVRRQQCFECRRLRPAA
jgi:Recombinase